MRSRLLIFFASLLLSLMGCAHNPSNLINDQSLDPAVLKALNPDDLLIVDCLLPGSIRKLGTGMAYQGARRALKTSALNCERRGGEYVAYDRANQASTLAYWQPLATEGDALAQTYVGEIYEKGLGVTPDYAKAASWYEKAAAQGVSRALMNLGYLYESGLGVEQNIMLALAYYRQAAGFDEGELEYVSSLELAQREAKQIAYKQAQIEIQEAQTELNQAQNEQAQLKTELSRLRQTLNQLKSDLVDTEKALSTSQVEQAQQEKAFSNSQAQHAQQEKAHSVQTQTLSQQNKTQLARIRDLETQLKKKAKAISREIKRSQQAQATLADLKNKNKEVATVASTPVIEIIQPPLIALRDAKDKPSISIPSDKKSITLRGRIKPVAQINSFNINGQQTQYDRDGFFKLTLSSGKINTALNLSATNKQGRRTVLDIMLMASQHSNNPLGQKNLKLKLGHYHALVIGNNKYQHFPKLKTAINDAKTVAKILRQNYNFKQVKLLQNTSRAELLQALNQLMTNLGKNDNLLIYYAGHGELNKAKTRGYWLPIDATPNNVKTWVSNAQISNYLSVIKAKHVLVVADSCYSGILSGSSIARPQSGVSRAKSERWYKTIAKTRTRVVISSGGVKPVLDTGENSKHSVFASAFIRELQRGQGIMEGYNIYLSLYDRVRKSAKRLGVEQHPQYAPIKHTGHEAGEFLLSTLGS